MNGGAPLFGADAANAAYAFDPSPLPETENINIADYPDMPSDWYGATGGASADTSFADALSTFSSIFNYSAVIICIFGAIVFGRWAMRIVGKMLNW